MPKLKLSNRARNTPPSPIRKLAPLANKAMRSGIHVYHLNIGQPDIESPREFFDGLRQFDQKVVVYEQSQGNEGLCIAWSKYVNRIQGLGTRPEQFLITTGASEALIFLFLTCCDPGDEVIVFDPTYANYLGFASIADVRPAPVLTRMEENFALPARDEIERRITARTRAILFCNPNNPTGAAYGAEDLETLYDLCEANGLYLIVDETYREFVYDGLKPLSILNLVPASDRVVVVDSLSKRFSLCGARLGCLITANEEILAATLRMAQARLASPTIDQFAAAYMLEHIKDEYLEGVRNEFLSRRDALCEALRDIPGVTAHKPRGAFYSLVGLPVIDTDDFAAFLLSRFSHKGRTTFIAPAGGFYMQPEEGKQEARFAYVLNKSEILSAIEALAAGLQQYLKK
jgi:aspartate aminotransferase